MIIAVRAFLLAASVWCATPLYADLLSKRHPSEADNQILALSFFFTFIAALALLS